MQIHLTFDYELFFGSNSGSAKQCVLNPTQQLIELATKYTIPLVFYVDAGYLVQLKKNAHIPQCDVDYIAIVNQLKQLQTLGHEIGLHVHPHWQDCVYENNAWQINTSRYKLADFNEEEIEAIVTNYHQALIDITKTPCKSYRAGGWCIQPFNAVKSALQKNSIFIDTSVYYKGMHLSPAHAYNFSSASNKDVWQFENDPCIEVDQGRFTEIPTTPDSISPLFYWNLYFKMKTNPNLYKPVGDGNWLVDKKRVYKHFYSRTNHFACADGFFASRLISILKTAEKNKKQRMSVLIHPKSMASYSFKELERFIGYAHQQGHTFTTIAQ